MKVLYFFLFHIYIFVKSRKAATAMCSWLSSAPEQTRLAVSIKGWQDTIVKLLALDIALEEYSDLTQKVVEILFLISWKGVKSNSHEKRWIERLGVWCSLQATVKIP